MNVKPGNIGKTLIYAVVIFLVVSLATNAISYFNFNSSYGFLKLKQDAIASGWYLPFYYCHVLTAGFILLIGLFQLHPASRRKFSTLHKILGYFYVMGILFVSAPGALVMTLFINRGPVVLTSFLLQTVLWFYFTVMAFQRIRGGDVAGHQHWMYRSYALTFAAVTLRIYIFIISWSFDLSTPSAYATLAWLSWVPNLLVAEIIVRSAASYRVKDLV